VTAAFLIFVPLALYLLADRALKRVGR